MERKFEPDDIVVNVCTGQEGKVVGFMTGKPMQYLVKGSDFEEWMREPVLEEA